MTASHLRIETILRVFDRCSQLWAEGPQLAYARALVEHGGYVPEDADSEAAAVGGLTRREFLTPFLVQAPFEDLGQLDDALGNDGQLDATRRAIFVLGAGNTGLPLILNIVIGLAAGKVVYARPSRRNIEAIRAWLAALEQAALEHDALEHDDGGEASLVRERVVLLDIAHEAGDYEATLGRLPIRCAYLWGGAEALERTAALLAPSVQCYQFGPRTGVLLLECAHWASLGELDRRAYARATYDNLLRYDAALCSSPTIGLVIGEREQARAVLDELCAAMVPEADERRRLERLVGANARRRDMRGWVAHGYTLHHAPKPSLVTLALGGVEDYRERNRYLPSSGSFHESAGSLELLCFTDDERSVGAALVAGLQHEPRYAGRLWGVGHVATIASEACVTRFIAAVSEAQQDAQLAPCEPERLAAIDWRVVDLRDNIGRRPGERFDGVALLPSMLLESR